MGATNLYVEYNGNSMSEAYKAAVEDALHDWGHDPYNGTISTTSGFIDKTSAFNGDLDAFESKALDNTEKWESVWGAKVGENKYVFVGWAAE
jgi:hypothetical protein